MKPIYEARCCQIEITNYCNMKCPNCTRFIGHHKKPYFMTLEQVEEALQSLDGYKGIIGCMGGEPTIHPEFIAICSLFKQYLPKERRGLWTNGLNWDKYEDVIRETFPIKQILYNNHDYKYEGQHQPLLIASKDIIKDEKLRKELIDDCWIQSRWSPSINPNGAFFCEVAAAMDILFNLGGGWEVKEGWWDKEPKDFQDQVDIYCHRCSACIPFHESIYKSKREYISISNIEGIGIKNVNFTIPQWGTIYSITNKDGFYIYDEEYTREDYETNVKNWNPGQFRNFEQHEPNKRIYK